MPRWRSMQRSCSPGAGCSSSAGVVVPRVIRVTITLVLAIVAGSSAGADAPTARIVVQDAPLAGFVYYDGRALWDDIRKGDRLTLVREPANPHDANAVRIEWQGGCWDMSRGATMPISRGSSTAAHGWRRASRSSRARPTAGTGCPTRSMFHSHRSDHETRTFRKGGAGVLRHRRRR